MSSIRSLRIAAAAISASARERRFSSAVVMTSNPDRMRSNFRWRESFSSSLSGEEFAFSRRSAFLPIRLGIETAHPEITIGPAGDRCQEHRNCRGGVHPAGSSFRKTPKSREKRSASLPSRRIGLKAQEAGQRMLIPKKGPWRDGINECFKGEGRSDHVGISGASPFRPSPHREPGL